MNKKIIAIVIASAFASIASASDLSHLEKTNSTESILEELGVISKQVKETKQRILAREKHHLVMDKQFLTQEFERTGQASIVTKTDGTVIYPYARMPAVLTCAPLRVCTIQLNEDEKVLNAAAGDTARWQINPAKSGKRDVAIVKPLQDGLSTNLVITTDKRIYNVELRSRKIDAMTSIGFWYPEESLVQKWSNEQNEKAEIVKDQAITTTTLASNKLNFDYEIEGNARPYLMPVRVYDDNQQVIIQMSEDMKRMEAPALFVLDASGTKKLVNYRVKNGNFIVDKLFDRAVMLLGHDDNQETIEIRRKDFKSPESISADYSKHDGSFEKNNENNDYWWWH
jgi:type IV secretion system protein VirB9